MSDPTCTLDPEARSRRRQELLAGLATRVRGRRELPDGIELRFDRSAERLRELADFIAFESGCCSFLDFELRLESGDPELVLRLTGPAGTRELLAPWLG